jgi:hypothetical protein
MYTTEIQHGRFPNNTIFFCMLVVSKIVAIGGGGFIPGKKGSTLDPTTD